MSDAQNLDARRAREHAIRLLARVELMRERERSAQQGLRSAVCEAAAAGLGVAALAGALGVSRQTIYNWISEREKSEG